MTNEVSSIDDMLTQSQNPGTTTPQAPEQESDYDNYSDNDSNIDNSNLSNSEIETSDNEDSHRDEQQENDSQTRQYDDYGNEKQGSKTYTEDEVNERINKAVRERLARANNHANQQPAQQQQIQQQAQGFEYNPESDGNWQQQLEAFVEQTFQKMTQKTAQRQQQEMERIAESEFLDKFSSGMERFNDFKDVVGSQPISDPMALALRGINDPAAFIYAASKRNPQELERIYKLKDPYSQMVEIGKLEERMRKRPQGTNAPRPLGRSHEDAPMKYVDKSKKEDSIEDMIHKAEQKKLEKLRKIRGK